jgi:hypothetical protein
MDRYGSNFGFIYILLLSFLHRFLFSFLSSCSSRPLETQKLWFFTVYINLSEGRKVPTKTKTNKKWCPPPQTLGNQL